MATDERPHDSWTPTASRAGFHPWEIIQRSIASNTQPGDRIRVVWFKVSLRGTDDPAPLLGAEKCSCGSDAAYVWTHGGYQIARSHDEYPIFIAVHDRDIERWLAFFEQYGLDVSFEDHPDSADVDSSVHYVLFPRTDGIDVEWVDGNPVIPVEAAIEQMLENRPAYEPALEMITEEYDVDIDAHHHETSATS